MVSIEGTWLIDGDGRTRFRSPDHISKVRMAHIPDQDGDGIEDLVIAWPYEGDNHEGRVEIHDADGIREVRFADGTQCPGKFLRWTGSALQISSVRDDEVFVHEVDLTLGLDLGDREPVLRALSP